MGLTTLSDVKLPIGKDESELKKLAEKKLGGKAGYFAIKKKSLDARDKENIRFVYTVEFSREAKKEEVRALPKLPKNKLPKDPVLVVGSGPAGLFATLRLIEYGFQPILIERGAPVDEREKKINLFFTEKTLDVNANVQFGEGGAGTFSDGKLNTQTHSPLNREVLETFVRFGAPKEILWLSKPHVGSDNLKNVVKAIREYVKNNGGQVLFHTRLDDLRFTDGRVTGAVISKLNADTVGGNTEILPVSAVVLAVGHSARDTFERLLARGIPMRSKDFAVGVRIEHLQSKIGFSQYGKSYPLLPPAEYKLVSHASNRSAFTFCMCPGGYVMPATSEEGMVVTNGMSNYARDGVNANSALIAQVTKADFLGDDPLSGMRFQRELERKAFQVGGANYSAPVQRLGDFLQNKETSRFGDVEPTYSAGVTPSDLRAVLPAPVVETLKNATLDMDRRLRGFADPDALLTAVETRTSSPVRIERDDTMQSVGVKGLYPCGEGAGYAGGITSSAVDGLRVAEAIYRSMLENE